MSKKKIEVSEEQAKIIDALAERHRKIFVAKEWKKTEELEAAMRQTEHDVNHWLTKWPEHPLFVFHAGVFYAHTERAGLAINLFHRAMQQGLETPPIYTNLAGAYKSEHNDEMAEHYYMQGAGAARKANDLHALAHAYHGVGSLYINRGDPHTCIKWCDRALDIDPDDRFARWNKGIACLEAGLWEEGGRLYHEAGFIESKWKAQERKIKTYGGLPQWDGTPGKTVITYGEQGVGDEVMFASIIPDLLRDCKVIIDCDPRLEHLFRRSFPDAEGVYPTSEVDAEFPWIVNHKPDAHIAMGSLLHFYRKKAEDFPKVPFLKADPELRKKWRAHLDALGPGKHVAISYAGGLKKTRQDMRTINPKELVEIIKIPSIHWHSTQYHDFSADNAAIMGRMTNVPVHHWHDVVSNWEDWSAFLSEIDLLITVNTSVHHLAGSLGVPQWCLTPKYVAWRYGTSGPSPFYGKCSMYRQGPEMKWEPVLEKVKHDLEGWINGGSLLHQEDRTEPRPADNVATTNGDNDSGGGKGASVANRAVRKGARRRGKRR